jgi:hypothetical protein
MPTNLRSAWPQLVGQAWADAAFRQRLLSDPKRVLDELGVELPADHAIELVEDTPSKTFLVLPQRPAHLDALASLDGPSLSTGIRADACTATPEGVPKPFACTQAPACTATPEGVPKPFACTQQPACTQAPACTNNPGKG